MELTGMYDMQEREVVGLGYVRNEGGTSYAKVATAMR